MASTVVAQRHLWLPHSNVPDRYRDSYLDEPLSFSDLFGQSLKGIQSKFKVHKRETEALLSIIPMHDIRRKATVMSRRAMLTVLSSRRTKSPVASGPAQANLSPCPLASQLGVKILQWAHRDALQLERKTPLSS